MYTKVSEFHGHFCPGLAIGIRASEAAMEKLQIQKSSQDEEIVCVTENDSCAVDAIQYMLSTTIGKGNLIYRKSGKMAFTFFRRDTGEGIRMYFKAENRQNLEREDWKNHILSAPLSELFTFSEPKFPIPQTARIFRSVQCAVCGEKCMESVMHLQNGKPVCPDCFSEYGRGW